MEASFTVCTRNQHWDYDVSAALVAAFFRMMIWRRCLECDTKCTHFLSLVSPLISIHTDREMNTPFLSE